MVNRLMRWDRQRATGGWHLYAESGELIGRVRSLPGDCFEARLEPDFGGKRVAGTDLDAVRDWMIAEARRWT